MILAHPKTTEILTKTDPPNPACLPQMDDCDAVVLSSESMPSSEPPSGDESSRTLTGNRKVPRWRKKYLVAGLFSDYYKDGE